MNKSEKITDMRQTLIKKIIIITDKIKNKYGLKSKNLNYNSQIFTLTLNSLFLHSTSSSIKRLLRAAVVLFLSDQIRTVGLLLLLLLLRCLITVTHGKSKKFLSFLKFRFLFIFLFFYFLSLPG